MYTFSDALIFLKRGSRVYRQGWNGKGQWIKLETSNSMDSEMSLPYLYIHTVQGDLVPWLASQTDLLANDWEVMIEIEK